MELAGPTRAPARPPDRPAHRPRQPPGLGGDAQQAERDRLHHGTPSTVVLIDLDNLKLANDTLGHQFGDQLIVAIAMAVLDRMRPQDFGARIGGDELAILVQGSETTALQLQLEVRGAIEAAPALGDFPLSASLGSASSPPATAVSDAVALADARMYATSRPARPAAATSRRSRSASSTRGARSARPRPPRRGPRPRAARPGPGRQPARRRAAPCAARWPRSGRR